MVEHGNEFSEFGFESLTWSKGFGESSSCTTPVITPGPLSTANRVDDSGIPVIYKLTAGIHWYPTSYPAWTGLQPPKDAQYSQYLPHTLATFELSMSQDKKKKWTRNLNTNFIAPFGVDHIARMVEQIRELLGFQFDAAVSAFELLMSQLDSRASRTCPKQALKSLHSDYIGGSYSNYRKWYFAAEMDRIDHDNERRTNPMKENRSELKYDDTDDENENLSGAEAIWEFRFGVATDQQRIEEVIIYLLCWTEANQMRFMPECLAFIVKCAREYYYSMCETIDQCSDEIDIGDMRPSDTSFLDHVITPLYKCYRSYNFSQTENGNWIRREGDHKDFIGYDDMNQLFWYRAGLESIKVLDSNGISVPLVSLPPNIWYAELRNVDWSKVFSKTYRESRSWLHIVTNFSRIWILHAAVFWFYTSFNSPSLYTVGYNYTNPVPPQNFVRWTVMSLGGLIGPVITFVALMGELRFIPRVYPGAKPVLPRVLSVIVMSLALGVPAICNLVFNDWSISREEYDLVPATVVAGVLFAMAVVYTLYFSYQPLDHIFRGMYTGITRHEREKVQRKYLANKYFTAKFPKLNRNDWIVSWIMCLSVFLAKMLESYFFLTLSLRDPIRELDIMSLEDKCLGDSFLIGTFLCRYYPKIILITTILTDMVLFFLDTYLWYVIFNTGISICIAVSGGTSIWTPWRNIYSRLSQRISSKLLVSNTDAVFSTSSAAALRIIWASIVEGMYESHLVSREQANKLTQIDAATQEPSFFTTNEDGRTFTASTAAYRRISFFAQSLSTPMQPVMAVAEMPSFTVLIPHYKEKINLSLRDAINTESGSKVTTLEYLRKLYPVEWENFVHKEQLCRESTTAGLTRSERTTKIDNVRQEYLSKVGFSTCDPNDTNPTRVWSSERSQTLYRTVRGFYNYSQAIKVLSYAENHLGDPKGQQSNENLAREVAQLVNRKFRLLIAMQLYDTFTPEQLQEVETLFNAFPNIVISFVVHEIESDSFYSCLIDHNCPLLDTGKRCPKMKIKLSGNPIIGDGKSDNQNSALVFYRGEYIQLIDANQDNYLEECLKIRNVLMEFETDGNVPIKVGPRDSRCPEDSEANFSVFGNKDNVAESTPVAIVGAREYIFSENIGVLGDIAAGKEQTFGTLFARTLAKIGGKLHYGHPDILNGIFMTTRGGVSKGQRGLHLNEDIYAGMTAILRGGRIRHSEYFQCGKGRDLGFVSILNFTAKIGAGMGEQMLSREYFYMGTQLPFDRFISFYYAHPGFHLNNVFIMLSLEMLLIVTLWFASLASVSTACNYDRKAPPTELHRPAGCKNILPLLEWTRRCVVSIFLVFLVSLCPPFFQEVNEKGFYQSVKRIFKHFCSLSMLFEIFVCRIYARSFWEDLNIGGAKYVATGRGFATARISFHKLFSGYRSEMMSGLKAIAILTYASICLWHASYLWFWVTTFSLCMCPFLYNPHQFSFVDFFLDYQRLLLWFFEAVTPVKSSDDEVSTWSEMAKSNRNKLTGVKKRTMPSECSRPSFRNTMISEVGKSLATTIILGIPYIYIDTQKTSRHQNGPDTSAILRVGFIALLPLAINGAIVFLGFLISMLLHLIGAKKSGNYVAAVSRTFYVCVLIMSWWILYILERQRFTSTLLGIMTAASLQYAIETILVVVILRRQRNARKTNDPWWTGNWRAARLRWKWPLIVFEELMIKTTESLRVSYDFLASHFLLGIQIPLVFIPFMDKVHCLFLLWLQPGVCADAAKCFGVYQSKKRKKRAQLFCLVFVLILAGLITLLTLPFYLPELAKSKIVELIDYVVPWDAIK